MTIRSRLIRFAEVEYPAQIIMGRATPQGVLVMADGKVLKNEDAAVSRMDKLLGLELAGGLQYTYELAPESNLGPTIDEMRRELEQEAAANGLPIRAWK